MRHGKHFRKLNRTSEHRRALFRNMATSLCLFDRLRTTTAKAKELRPIADKLVSMIKYGTHGRISHARNYLMDNDARNRLIEVITPRLMHRYGGYTRVLHAGRRRGDNAAMSYIEFLDNPLPPLRDYLGKNWHTVQQIKAQREEQRRALARAHYSLAEVKEKMKENEKKLRDLASSPLRRFTAAEQEAERHAMGEVVSEPEPEQKLPWWKRVMGGSKRSPPSPKPPTL